MKKFLKYALRSRSVGFAKAALSGNPTGAIIEVDYRGKPVHYREGSSDALVIYEILLKGRKSEYWHARLPPPDEVKVVLDIGANVGAATVFFSELYPMAKIHAFEPIPGNLEILKMNAASRDRPGSIECHLLALSDRDGELQMIHSPGAHNHGGWSFYQRGAAGDEEKVSVPVRKSGDFVRELGLERIDVIKIDTEGAEKEILHGLTPEQLASVQYIVGELHGERDFELLDWLEQREFDIECKKSFGKPCFIFKALRPNTAA
ncbi:MAG: FkbM family methyltransferase [Sulfuritalea sp.]|nr:FkbM family methyltransferase [Sulfuritalea sp.]